MKSKKIFFLVMMLAVLVFGFSSAVFATKEKSPVTCEEVGAVTVKCYECTAGSEKYLGTAAVHARYEEDDGKKYCVHTDDAKSACRSRFGAIKRVGFLAKYMYRTNIETEWLNKSCLSAAGN